MSLYDPSALRADLMPRHERVILDIFESPANTLGLFLDSQGAPLIAWHIGYIDPEAGHGYAFTTATWQRVDWVSDTTSNPLAWLYGDPEIPSASSVTGPIWEGNEEPVVEITTNGIIDLSADGSGKIRTGEQIAGILTSAGAGRFFAIGEPKHQFPALLTRDYQGRWRTSGCGPDIDFAGPYPKTDARDLEAIREDPQGYDTPFLEPPIPGAESGSQDEGRNRLARVDSSVVAGRLLGRDRIETGRQGNQTGG